MKTVVYAMQSDYYVYTVEQTLPIAHSSYTIVCYDQYGRLPMVLWSHVDLAPALDLMELLAS